MRRKARFVFATVTLALLSCGARSRSAPAFPYFTEPDSLDYLLADSDAEWTLAANCQDGLTEIDRYGRALPALAETWSRNADATEWTFTLKPGLYWADSAGTATAYAIDAEDFVEGVRRSADPRTGPRFPDPELSLVRGVDAWRAALRKAGAGKDPEKRVAETFAAFGDKVGVRAKDARTVEFKLARSAPWFPSTLASAACFLPVDPGFIAKVGARWASAPDALLYSGPYRIAAVSEGRIELSKNERYWDTAVPIERAVSLVRYADPGGAVAALLSGDVDQVELDASAASSIPDGLAIPGCPGSASWAFLMNYRSDNPEFAAFVADPRFREALDLAIDRKALAEIAMRGARAATILTPKGIAFDERGIDYADRAEFEGVLAGGPDAARARAAFVAAAAELAPKGKIPGVTEFSVDRPPSAPVKVDGLLPLQICYSFPLGEEAAAAAFEAMVENALGPENVDVVLAPFEGERHAAIVAPRRFDIVAERFEPRRRDPSALVESLAWDGSFGDQWPGGGEFDAAAERARTLVPLAERHAAYAALERSAIDVRRFIPWMVEPPTAQAGKVAPFSRPRGSIGLARWRYKGLRLLGSNATPDVYTAARLAFELDLRR
jgi:oligopeptide transport system substrate-binding protein